MKLGFLCFFVLAGCVSAPPSKTASAVDTCSQGWTDENRDFCRGQYDHLRLEAHTEGSQSVEKATRIPRSFVCGTWHSVTSNKVYEFRCRGNGAFDVLEVRPNTTTMIGDGLQVAESVTASVDIDVEGQTRHAQFKLRVLDSDNLVGMFVGRDPREVGNIHFIRQR